MADQSIVLITGASSGVGRATARLLADKGYRVFGTSRRASEVQAHPGVEMLDLDVRSDESARDCVASVVARAGRVDALVNNAGVELGGAIEEVTVDEARALFETNLLGVHRMVREVLPAMRTRRRGTIVNISSVAGIASVPFLGMYSASKFALEGYTEALFHEVRPFGVRVSQIETSFLNTPMREHRQHAANPIPDYAPWRNRAFASVRREEAAGPTGELLAETVLDVLSKDSPRLRYVVGPQSRRITRLRRFLPAGLFIRGTRSMFRLDHDRES